MCLTWDDISLGASWEGLVRNMEIEEQFVEFSPLVSESEVEMKDFSSFPIVIDQSDHETNTSRRY